MTLLWLDDTRNPFLEPWINALPITKESITRLIWVKNYYEFSIFIQEHGLPEFISFDHDLGIPKQLELRAKGASKLESRRKAKETEKTGKDCANWLVEYCLDNSKELPSFAVHSMNPTGRDNILGLLNNFKNRRK